VDGSKCISYYTIELKDNIPDHVKGSYGDWIFGCDICHEIESKSSSFGLMGGAMQPQGHAQIVINLIDFGMNLQEAADQK